MSEQLYPKRVWFPQNPIKRLTIATVRNLKSSGVNLILLLYLLYGITTWSRVYHNMQHYVARIQYVFIKQINRAESQKEHYLNLSTEISKVTSVWVYMHIYGSFGSGNLIQKWKKSRCCTIYEKHHSTFYKHEWFHVSSFPSFILNQITYDFGFMQFSFNCEKSTASSAPGRFLKFLWRKRQDLIWVA